MGRLPRGVYGWGHHAEHAEAARKGWIARHHDKQHEARYVSGVYGDVHDVHTHPKHRNMVNFRQGDEWYELKRSDWNRLVSIGRQAERDAERDRKRGEKAERIEARYRDAQQRQLERIQTAEYHNIMRDLKKKGGIRPTYNKSTGKSYDEGEWRVLPSSIRRKSGHFTLDTAREHVQESYPHLQLDTPDELVSYLDRQANRKRHITARRRNARAA